MSQLSDTFELPTDGGNLKVFVATESLEGEHDFSFTVPGELVHLAPAICDCPDCGCERAMAGFSSHKGTTSFVVRDLDLDPRRYSDLLFETLEIGGWVSSSSAADRSWVREWAEEHVEMAADLPTEVLLRVDAGRVTVRQSDPQAET